MKEFYIDDIYRRWARHVNTCERCGEWANHKFKTEYVNSKHTEIRISVVHKTNVVAAGNLSIVKGTEGLLLSHGSLVGFIFRGKGYGSLLHKLKLIAASTYLGNSGMIICTVNSKNTAEKKILEKYNWTKIQQFTFYNDIDIYSTTAHARYCN